MARPKSYDTGVGVGVGRPPSGDLMIFQGPTCVDWGTADIDDGSVENCSPADSARPAAWLKANVHVPAGRSGYFSSYTRTRCKTGLHFSSPACGCDVRAPWSSGGIGRRSAFTTSRRARHTTSSRPPRPGTRAIPTTTAICHPPPANRRLLCSAPWKLRSWSPDHVHVDLLDNGPVRLTFARPGLRSVAGRLRKAEVRWRGDEVVSLRLVGDGPFEVRPPAEAEERQKAGLACPPPVDRLVWLRSVPQFARLALRQTSVGKARSACMNRQYLWGHVFNVPALHGHVENVPPHSACCRIRNGHLVHG